MALRYRQRILDHLAHARYQPSTVGAMAREMNIEAEDRDEFQAAIDQMIEDRELTIGKDSLVRLPTYENEVVGKLRVNQRGFGFITPDTPHRDGDLFVPPNQIQDAISGDRVRARVVHQPQRGRGGGRSPYVGHVLEVIERGQDQFVGVLDRRGGDWIVVPDGRLLHDPVIVRDPHAKNAKIGDKVVLELLHYPEGNYLAEGVITKVLGKAGRPDVETQAVIEAHGLRTDFPPEAIEHAREVSRKFDQDSAEGPWPNREDLTGRFIFTIDPPDAKDFDDAISIERDDQAKTWTLGVHIADVSHFVKPGDAIDREAMPRGNSVYLPRLVIPMLPEVLSNGVCSLQEGVNRFTKSAFITFNDKGRVLDQRVASTVIRSRKRMTYLEAQALIDGDKKLARQHARTDTSPTDELIQALQWSDRLAKILRERRKRDGMIVLNLPEVELVFDDEGHVVDAVPEDDAFTHTIIEMFMVEANEALARLFSSLNTPILRRIHPEPSFGDMQELQMYARAAKVAIPKEPSREDFQRLLIATHDTPAARAIHFAALRTLAKASYSPAMVGHYALASDHYAHFTSPIRRYPDLTLHRALAAFLELTENGSNVPGGKKRSAVIKRLREDDRVPDEGALITLGNHCSETEVEAAEAERELRTFLVMQFLKDKHLGDEFPGIITGVVNGGVFVSIEQYLVEGLVRTEDLPSSGDRPDRWTISDSTGRLVARRSGASLGIGDSVTVRIDKVDLASRHLDLAITTMPERLSEPDVTESGRKRGRGKDKGKKDRGKRRKGRRQ